MLHNGRRVLAIGAGAGIGRSVALLFADEGATVVVADIDRDGGEETVALLAGRGHSSLFLQLDVTHQAAVDEVTRRALEWLGGLDVVVTTPWVMTAFDIQTLTAEAWHRSLDVLATGTLYAFQAALPTMIEQGHGVLLATSSSMFGDYGARNHPIVIPAYAAGKAAVELIVRATARVHGRDGIRANAVQPGPVLTGAGAKVAAQREADPRQRVTIHRDTSPLGLGQPDDVAEAFCFLASDYASYVTGYSMLCDGGLMANASGRLLP